MASCPYCGSSATRVFDADPEEGEWLDLECAECGFTYDADALESPGEEGEGEE